MIIVLFETGTHAKHLTKYRMVIDPDPQSDEWPGVEVLDKDALGAPCWVPAEYSTERLVLRALRHVLKDAVPFDNTPHITIDLGTL